MEQHQDGLRSLNGIVKVMQNRSFLNIAKILNSEMCLDRSETIKLTETT